MTVLKTLPARRSGRHRARRTRGLIFWLAVIDAAVFAACVIIGAVHR
jgi:hypothetical protein